MGRLNFNIILLALLSLQHITSFSQKNLTDVMPGEKVSLNTNTHLLVTGETLYYSLYCINKETKLLSNISKIAYVYLVNDSKNVVFKHKLKLDNGRAYGDYFIPSNLKTGNYKLIAFTKWMNNDLTTPHYSSDLYIINPFRKNKTSFANNKVDSLVKVKPHMQNLEAENNPLSISTDSKTYSTRSKATLSINTNSKNGLINDYSISIRKLDDVKLVVKNNSTPKKQSLGKVVNENLPEIRGEIVSGVVLSKEDNTPVINKLVSLSISGNNTIFKNVKTNDLGRFYFNIYENYTSGKIILQVLEEDNDKYKIVVDDVEFRQSDQLDFHKIYLDSNIKNWLLQRKINNQIENAFYETKKDSVVKRKTPDIFCGQAEIEYILDDFTRFKTVKETFVEIVTRAAVRDKNKRIVVYSAESVINKQLPDIEPLILIDGIPIINHEILINYDAREIEKISIINNVYFYGPQIYKAILSVITKKGNFNLPYSAPYTKKAIKSPLQEKRYYNPIYQDNDDRLKRIPDHRNQLLWIPNANDNTKEFIFYTSDIKGVFEIKVEGYTKTGKHTKAKGYFTVE